MVREGGVHAGQFHLRHVAGHALPRTHRAGIGVAASGFRISRFRQVTGEAFRIVIRHVSLQLLVRIVTSNAANSRIVRVVPATIEHPIRLKANIVYVSLSRLQHRLLKTRVTRAAKRLRQLVRTQITRIENLQTIESLRVRCNQMLLAWPKTILATHTRIQLVQLQLQAMNRTRRMTTETLLRLFATDCAS